MKYLTAPVAIAGFVAVFFAIVWNEVTATTHDYARQLVMESIAASLAAIACGAFVFRQGKFWKYLSIVIIGPAVFMLADATVRLVALSQH